MVQPAKVFLAVAQKVVRRAAMSIWRFKPLVLTNVPARVLFVEDEVPSSS